MEVCGGADIHPAELVDASRRLWSHRKPVLEQDPCRTCASMKRGSHTGRTYNPVADQCCLFLEDCIPWKRPTPEQFVNNHSLRKYLHWSKATALVVPSLRWKQRQKQHDELTTTPISCPPAALRRGGGESEIKFSLWRREGLGKHIFKIWVYFSLFYYDLIHKKFNNFLELSLFCPWW